jgi:hypothetical protein
MPTVDSATVTLDHGGTDSLTLNWSTSTDDKGDWTATANDPVGGSDSTSVSVVETHTRTTTAVSPGGDAVVTRVLDGARSTLASGAGDASITRTADVSRSALASGSGAASVTRALDAVRTTSATSPGGEANVSRVFDGARTTVGHGTGAGETSRSLPKGWLLPLSAGAGTMVAVTPVSVETDHDMISLETTLDRAKVDALKPRYGTAGDVDREETAFGAFRRVPRDGAAPITPVPGEEWRPPFDVREVVPEDFTADQVFDSYYEVSIDLGLESPRAREALDGAGETKLVASRTTSRDHGESGTVTLRWEPTGDDVGEWLAEASVENYPYEIETSDDALVTVTDAPYTLEFPVESLYLTAEQLGPLDESVNQGVPTQSLELRLDAGQAAKLFAVGSRVEAARQRAIPDAPNTIVDTLPDEELTATLQAPAESDFKSGDYVLTSWDVQREHPGERPYHAKLELLER